jgi:hypothetical protein
MNEEQRIEGRIRTLPPCKGCDERFTACHDKCPKDERGEYGYHSWRSQLDELNERRKEYNRKPFVQYNPFDY